MASLLKGSNLLPVSSACLNASGEGSIVLVSRTRVDFTWHLRSFSFSCQPNRPNMSCTSMWKKMLCSLPMSTGGLCFCGAEAVTQPAAEGQSSDLCCEIENKKMRMYRCVMCKSCTHFSSGSAVSKEDFKCMLYTDMLYRHQTWHMMVVLQTRRYPPWSWSVPICPVLVLSDSHIRSMVVLDANPLPNMTSMHLRLSIYTLPFGKIHIQVNSQWVLMPKKNDTNNHMCSPNDPGWWERLKIQRQTFGCIQRLVISMTSTRPHEGGLLNWFHDFLISWEWLPRNQSMCVLWIHFSSPMNRSMLSRRLFRFQRRQSRTSAIWTSAGLPATLPLSAQGLVGTICRTRDLGIFVSFLDLWMH